MPSESAEAPRAANAGCTPETERCAFWTWGEGAVRPDCCTAHLRDMVFFTSALLTRHGIHHWLDFGALLGAVREQAIIAFDYDADFSCLAADKARVAALEPEFRAQGYVLDLSEGDHVWRIWRSPVNRNHVDLFPFYPEGGELRLPGKFRGRSAFPIPWAHRLAPVRLYDRELPAPAPVEEFLIRYRYGPGFRTPRRSFGAPLDPAYRGVLAYLERKQAGNGSPS